MEGKMKLLISSLVLTFAFAGTFAFADEDHHKEETPNYRVCAARDANGREWRYYTSYWNPQTYTQRKALELCKAHSARPGTCYKSYCREW
jgi:hypothetical protein